MTRLRKNVWRLGAGDDTLTWYARAIAAMQAKPIGDPTSWRYQAAIHEYDPNADPLATGSDAHPNDADTFWTQCQHGSWYFLPWHRMYLHHFETIVAAEVERMGGPKDWALPYWNYSESQEHSFLPPAFRDRTLPDGSPNPLYAPRNPAANAGEPFADGRDTDLRGALRQPTFESAGFGGSSGFGGPATRFEHSGNIQGALEQTPHGTMHVAVGGREGWMSAFNTAALDPIFWIHHCNIDRLWDVWLRQQGAGHKNPDSDDFARGVSFPFHDASGETVAMTVNQVFDTRAAPLSYSYDDTADPFARHGMGMAPETPIVPTKKPPEMVGATNRPFHLEDGTTHAVFSARPPKAVPSLAPTQRRVFLNIENLTSTDGAPAHDVYLNVPEGADPHEHEDHYAGRLPMFGLAEASRTNDKHSGSGLHYVLDVTDLYGRLSAEPGWNATKLRVSFVAVGKHGAAKVQVGRVSLYVE